MIRHSIRRAISDAQEFGEVLADRSETLDWLARIDQQIRFCEVIEVDADATKKIYNTANTADLKTICSGMYPPFEFTWMEFDVSAIIDEYDRLGVMCHHVQDAPARDFEVTVFASKDEEITLPFYTVMGRASSGDHRFAEIVHAHQFIVATGQDYGGDAEAILQMQREITEDGLGLLGCLSMMLTKYKSHLIKRTAELQCRQGSGSDELVKAVQYTLSDAGVRYLPSEYPGYGVKDEARTRSRHVVRAHTGVSCKGTLFFRKSHERGKGRMVRKTRVVTT